MPFSAEILSSAAAAAEPIFPAATSMRNFVPFCGYANFPENMMFIPDIWIPQHWNGKEISTITADRRSAFNPEDNKKDLCNRTRIAEILFCLF
jgi:hypothetical protein